MNSGVVMLLTGFVNKFDNAFVFLVETYYMNGLHQNSFANGFKIGLASGDLIGVTTRYHFFLDKYKTLPLIKKGAQDSDYILQWEGTVIHINVSCVNVSNRELTLRLLPPSIEIIAALLLNLDKIYSA